MLLGSLPVVTVAGGFLSLYVAWGRVFLFPYLRSQVYLSIWVLRSVVLNMEWCLLHPRNTWQCLETFLVVTPGLWVGWVRTVFLASGGERQEAAKHPTMHREDSSHPSKEGSCSNSSTVTGTEAEKPCFRLSEPFIQFCTILPNGLGWEKGCVLQHQGHLVSLTHTRQVTVLLLADLPSTL